MASSTWANGGFGRHLVFFVSIWKLVEDSLVLDLPVLEEEVEGRLADGDHVFEDVPENSFGEGCCGQ